MTDQRPNSFYSYTCEEHELPSSTEETPPVEERRPLPYDSGEDDGYEKDDKESNEGSEQLKEPEEENESATVKCRKEDKNEKTPRDEPKTKKSAANPDNGSKRETRRSPTPLPASDVVPNAEDHSSGQLELSCSMVSAESGQDNQR